MPASGHPKRLVDDFSAKLRRAKRSGSNSFISFSGVQDGVHDGILHGRTAGIKDNLAVKGLRMTCASRVLENYVAPYDATVIARIRKEGCFILGKNNMDEFACGSSGENSAFGPTLNPLIPGAVPGGSSSGSAASVSEGLVDFAIGSDTGGSVRCPSAFCGAVGFKPTYGRVSRYGLADLSMSLEGPAPIAPFGSEALLAGVMDCISGPDEKDQSTAASSRTSCVREIDSFDPGGSSIIIPENALIHCTDEVKDSFEKSISFLKERGASVERVEMKTLGIALPCYYLIMYSEFASAMQRYDGLKFGTRGTGHSVEEAVLDSRARFGREVKRRILIGTYVTSAEGRSMWYERAKSAREEVGRELDFLLEGHDMLAMPTMPSAPYPLGSRTSDPLLMYASDILTVPASLAGLPAVSMPVGKGIGLQLVGPRNRDERIISAVRYFSRSGWRWRQ